MFLRAAMVPSVPRDQGGKRSLHGVTCKPCGGFPGIPRTRAPRFRPLPGPGTMTEEGKREGDER